MLRRQSLEETFEGFGYLVIFQVAFFILFTTIGLNIIFGIIVDTFSELRDLKWQAEKDMAECCFICGLPSYDFEHHAKKEKKKFDFFPVNRSLSLTNTEDDTECSRLDDMATNVRFLVDKHNQQETSKQAKVERQQQDRWRLRHNSIGVAPSECEEYVDDGDHAFK